MGLHQCKTGLHRCKTGFGWCKRLLGDFCSLSSNHLLHPLLTTFGNLPFSGSLSQNLRIAKLVTFLWNCYGSWVHVYRRRRIFFWGGGSPPSFGPFGWPAQFLSSTVPLVFLSHLFVCLFFALLQSFFIFRVEGGGRFPVVLISPPFLFRESFEGPVWSCWPKKRTFFGKEAAMRRCLCGPSCGFLRTFMENYLAIVAPKVTLLRNTTTAPHAKQAVQNLPATHDISQPALEFSALSSGWPDAWNV